MNLYSQSNLDEVSADAHFGKKIVGCPAHGKSSGSDEAYCTYHRKLDSKKMEKQTYAYLLNPSEEDLLLVNDQTVNNLRALGRAMIEAEPTDPNNDNASIPAGYTYWGQFIDHDITAATDRSPAGIITKPNFRPLDPETVVKETLSNERTPTLDLDSVYGDIDGPKGCFADLYDGAKLKVGTVDLLSARFKVPHEELGLDRDLPRSSDAQANLGDERNDENLIIAQFHLSFLKFHNAVVDAIMQGALSEEVDIDDVDAVFKRARRETVMHYQWLVVHDFLVQMIGRQAVNELLNNEPDPFFNADHLLMPVEFSVAAYRYGHSMVRNVYDFNINFGRPGTVFEERSTFAQLFAFTGGGAAANPFMTSAIPSNWIIDWDRFFFDPDDQPHTDRFARKIDPALAVELGRMGNEGANTPEDREDLEDAGRFNDIMKHLAQRNLLRGYILSTPTGQALARHYGTPVLDEAQLLQGNSNDMHDILSRANFLERTPLWFYILQEARVQNDGHALGALGSKIVGGTIVSLLQVDSDSYLNEEGGPWTPDQGIVTKVTGTPFKRMIDFQKFAGVRV